MVPLNLHLMSNHLYKKWEWKEHYKAENLFGAWVMVSVLCITEMGRKSEFATGDARPDALN